MNMYFGSTFESCQIVTKNTIVHIYSKNCNINVWKGAIIRWIEMRQYFSEQCSSRFWSKNYLHALKIILRFDFCYFLCFTIQKLTKWDFLPIYGSINFGRHQQSIAAWQFNKLLFQNHFPVNVFRYIESYVFKCCNNNIAFDICFGLSIGRTSRRSNR